MSSDLAVLASGATADTGSPRNPTDLAQGLRSTRSAIPGDLGIAIRRGDLQGTLPHTLYSAYLHRLDQTGVSGGPNLTLGGRVHRDQRRD